jgi:hypothetical protein
MTKLKLWKDQVPWKEAEENWDRGAEESAKSLPIKGLAKLPTMPGITDEAARHLKWKSLKWIVTQDRDRKILRGFLKHPFKYGFRFLKSICKGKAYKRVGDFFLYGLEGLEEFSRDLQKENTLLVIGFSYCHKPFECPSGRFTADCIRDPDHLVCRQCFIGKSLNALPENKSIPLLIPTIHYIGNKIFEIVHSYPNQQILFIITACEMTLEMFGDLGNMVGIKGIGVRLDGRICNTIKAFELSEQGIKPGLTVVLPETQKTILELIRQRTDSF